MGDVVWWYLAWGSVLVPYCGHSTGWQLWRGEEEEEAEKEEKEVEEEEEKEVEEEEEEEEE